MSSLLDEHETQWSNGDPSQGEDPPASKQIVRGAGELSNELHQGKLVGGKYRIGRVIGAGAMGTVVEAREVSLERKVAIKFLKADALGDDNAVARFLVEARLAAQLASDHAARVYGVDRLEDGTPYIVMEYLDGCDLAEWLTHHKSAPVARAVQFILEACDALDEAHRRGIIHRDVKPANLFAVDRANGHSRIKVLDFGISKMEAIVSDTLPPGMSGPEVVETQRSAIFGSVPYMSPEQMESARNVDRRTDIWSLGVTLWELLCGERPFRAASLIGLHATILSGVRPRLRELRPEASPELEAVVLRCLATHREDRFETAQALAEALRSIPLTVGATMVSAPWAEDSQRRASSGPPPTPKSAALWKLAVVAVLSAAVAIVLVRFRPASADHLPVGPKPPEAVTVAVTQSPRATVILSPPPIAEPPAATIKDSGVPEAAVKAAKQYHSEPERHSEPVQTARPQAPPSPATYTPPAHRK